MVGAAVAAALLGACSAGGGAAAAGAPPAASPQPSPTMAVGHCVTGQAAGAPMSQVPAGMGVARCVTGHSPPPRASAVLLGEGWGCAAFGSEAGASWQCWDAGPAPRAWSVPWLKDKGLQSGPDRLCEFARPALTFRCWQRPARGQTEGEELPASWEWLNPNHAVWGKDTYTRSDRLVGTYVGGTFGCVQAVKDNNVWCLGDDRFGQLGGSKPAPAPDAKKDDPAFVQHLWPAWRPALGTWHGCAIAAPGGLAHGGHVTCWGRGDYGQLGAAAPDACTVDGATIACARSPVKGPAVHAPMAALGAGDLFTCVSTPEGISCWGADRNAFFGTPGSCPDALRNAWPTPHGTVQAPRAACSPSPVQVAGASGFQQWFQAGPRGLCFGDASGAPRCVGGVPSPRAGIARVAMSPGEDASACGLRDGDVVCWGEGYSPPDALDAPVPIAFEATTPVGETAVVGPTDPTGWSAGCMIHRGCTLAPSPLTACAANVTPTDWAELLASVTALSGQLVSVRGVLGVSGGGMTLMGCSAPDGRACCNHSNAQVVLGGASTTLSLEGFFCTGDESAQCCNAPAYGETVIATGRLEPLPGEVGPSQPTWKLSGVSLCAPP